MKTKLIVAMVVTALALPMTASASSWQWPRVAEADGLMCPIGHWLRTPEQVMEERLTAIAEGDLDLFFCSYAVNAKVVMPGSVVEGRMNIRNTLLGLFGMLGGVLPTVTSLTFADGVALLTYFIETPVVSIPDGSDTFVIALGKIRYQTVHGTMDFGFP